MHVFQCFQIAQLCLTVLVQVKIVYWQVYYDYEKQNVPENSLFSIGYTWFLCHCSKNFIHTLILILLLLFIVAEAQFNYVALFRIFGNVSRLSWRVYVRAFRCRVHTITRDKCTCVTRCNTEKLEKMYVKIAFCPILVNRNKCCVNSLMQME